MLKRFVFVFGLGTCSLACSTSNGAGDGGGGGIDATPVDAASCAAPEAGAGPDAAREAGAAAPSLIELGVATTASGPSELVPSFSSAITDYYVKCGPGTNALAVSAKASSGAKAALSIESPGGALKPSGSAAADLSASLDVEEGQAVVATVTRGTASEAYWVRCLPSDMSPMQWTVYAGACSRPPGYYLMGDQAPIPGYAPYAMVLDRNGVPVWYRRPPGTAPYEPSSAVFDVDSIESGTISFIPWPSVDLTGPFQILDLSTTAITMVHANGWALDSHELRPAGNGHYYIFTDQPATGDLTGYDVPQSDGGFTPYGKGASYISCDILEVDTSGRVVWHWVSADHLDPVQDNTHPGLDPAPSGQQIPDPYHCNSIDVDAANGNLLVSARHEDSMFYVERSTGKVLWKMGGKTAPKDGASYVPVADSFHLQHDARLRPGWSACGGEVTVFDDQSYTTNPARGVVYQVNTGLSDGGKSCGTPSATVAWQKAGPVASNAMGDFRILPDGSRIIGWGTRLEQMGGIFTEYDAKGDALVNLDFTNQSQSYRAVKVPLAELDLGALRRTSGM